MNQVTIFWVSGAPDYAPCPLVDMSAVVDGTRTAQVALAEAKWEPLALEGAAQVPSGDRHHFPWRNYRLPSACSSDVACVLQSYSIGIACPPPPIPVPLALLARHAPLSSGVASATCTSSSSVRPPYVYVFLWCCLHPPPPHSTGVACTTCPVFLWSCIPTIRGQPTAVHLSRRVLP